MDLQKSAQLAAFIHDLTLPGRVSQNFQTHPEETRAGQKVWDIQQLDQAHRNGKCRQSCGGGMFLSLPLSHSENLCALMASPLLQTPARAAPGARPGRNERSAEVFSPRRAASSGAGFASENLSAPVAAPWLQTLASTARGVRLPNRAQERRGFWDSKVCVLIILNAPPETATRRPRLLVFPVSRLRPWRSLQGGRGLKPQSCSGGLFMRGATW